MVLTSCHSLDVLCLNIFSFLSASQKVYHRTSCESGLHRCARRTESCSIGSDIRRRLHRIHLASSIAVDADRDLARHSIRTCEETKTSLVTAVVAVGRFARVDRSKTMAPIFPSAHALYTKTSKLSVSFLTRTEAHSL